MSKEEINKKVEDDIKTAVIRLSEQLKELRTARGMSMADLYALSGVSSSTINDLEKGRYIPNIEVILKLGYALGMSANEILGILFKDTKKKNSKENAVEVVKMGLNDMGASSTDTKEILDFAEFKISKNIKITDSYK